MAHRARVAEARPPACGRRLQLHGFLRRPHPTQRLFGAGLVPAPARYLLNMNPHTPDDGRPRGDGPYLDVLTVLIGGIVFCLLLYLLFRHLFPASLWRDEETDSGDSASAATRELSYDTATADAAAAHVATLLSA